MRVAMLVMLASCTEAPTVLDDDEALNVAMSISSTLQPLGGGGELGAMKDADALVRGDMPVGFAEDADGMVRGVHLGFPYDYDRTCRDDNNRVRACDSHTANADVSATWASVLELSFLVTVTGREGTWMLNDITPEKLRLDGDSHLEYASRLRNVDGTTSTHDLSYDASHRGIVLFRDERWPRGGQVRYELTVTRARADQRWEYSVRVQAQFHAGGHATIVLPDHEFDLDLASGSLRAVQ